MASVSFTAGPTGRSVLTEPRLSRGARRWVHVFPAVIGLALFFAALEVLRVELRSVSWPELTRDVLAVPRTQLALAVLLTILNYAVLTGYDLVAFAYIGKALPRGRVMLASFLAYAIANNIGLAMVSGASVRYRFYTRWGATTEELSRIVFSYSVTFWLGLFALGGLSLAVTRLPESWSLPGSLAMPVGWVLMLVPVGYLAAAAIRHAPLRLWKLKLLLPSPRLASAQLTLSVVDWTLSGAVLYVLLPQSPLSFAGFMGAFLVAILLGMASHVDLPPSIRYTLE